MAKHIQFRAEVVPFTDKVKVIILGQTDIGNNFGKGYSWQFTASNGYLLRSSVCPEVRTGLTYLRGTDRSSDHYEMVFTLTEYDKFKAAVKEYNKVFSGVVVTKTCPFVKYVS